MDSYVLGFEGLRDGPLVKIEGRERVRENPKKRSCKEKGQEKNRASQEQGKKRGFT